MTNILALFGKSGAGKDTILNLLLQEYPDTFRRIVSCTTRPRREGELEGEDYYYLSDEQFAQLVYLDQFAEATDFNGWFYGTPISELQQDIINVGVFTPSGIESLLETQACYEDYNILPVYIETADKIRIQRCLDREESPDIAEICRRYGTDEQDFTDISFDYNSVINDTDNTDLLHSVNLIVNYCKGFFD